MTRPADGAPPPKLAIDCDRGSPAASANALALSRQLHLPFHCDEADDAARPELILHVRENRLELHETGRRARPLSVDFVQGPTGYRRHSGRGKNQLLGRAVGLKHGTRHVLDATAGLCRDAFLLACLGCKVTAVERSAAVAALVFDGLERARRAGLKGLGDAVERITLHVGDARAILARTAGGDRPDVIYLDPMYPARKGSAASGKELRILRRLVGDDPDAAELFEIARGAASRRVVVKRHRHAPPLVPSPDVQYPGRAVRYDAYLTRAGELA